MDNEPHTALEGRRLFAEALRLARQRYGHETGQGEISQKEFARMLGISGERPEERYRLYEGAKREPPLWILAALRRVTGYSLDNVIAQLPAGRPLTVERTANLRKRTVQHAPASPLDGQFLKPHGVLAEDEAALLDFWRGLDDQERTEFQRRLRRSGFARARA